MLFNSIQFAIFFPIAVLVYFLLPQKARNMWLLILSYFYYMCWEVRYALLMLASTAITYLSGIAIGHCKNISSKKCAVAASFILNIGILGFFKYAGFLLDIAEDIAAACSVNFTRPVIDILLPVGISFYIFQALSYTMDVYRGEVEPERNFFRYALFVSFFPQLVAGPIERSKNLLKQFDELHTFEYTRVRDGLARMLWGFFMKLVIAQRLAVVVDGIYEKAGDCSGFWLIVATALFALQIYCDFASYSEIAIGAAYVLGFSLMENFRQPFLAKSCKELWNRWHISLNTWFRDYLYFPLGGSKKGILRKHINLMIVFLVSGLWHGASWTYVIWGGLSGAFQVFGELLAGFRKKIGEALHIKKNTPVHSVLSIITTFMFFCMSLVFFRSENIEQALLIYKKIFTEFGVDTILSVSPFSLGLGAYHLLLLVLAVIILFFVDIFRERGNKLSDLFADKWYLRWGFYYVQVILILLSASFGAKEFIYFQF